MSAVCCPNCGSAVFPLQYLTEEERRAARQKTWRASAERRRRRDGIAVQLRYPTEEERLEARRKTWRKAARKRRKEMKRLTAPHRYWLDRYTLDEIRVLGSGLTMFDVSSTGPDASREGAKEVAA